MNHYLQAVGMIAALDIGRESRDAHGGRRQCATEELDALADVGWHLPDLKGIWTVCVQALRWRWRLRASHRLDPTPLPSAATTSH